eukprot:Hpha_TRINITY_DN29009_c0_g1::TRINITY_DN29009_c0_g1_i1::g.156533::m.156533
MLQRSLRLQAVLGLAGEVGEVSDCAVVVEVDTEDEDSPFAEVRPGCFASSVATETRPSRHKSDAEDAVGAGELRRACAARNVERVRSALAFCRSEGGTGGLAAALLAPDAEGRRAVGLAAGPSVGEELEEGEEREEATEVVME